MESHDLAEELARNNELLAKIYKSNTNWKFIVGRALLTGLATVVGATVGVSLVVLVLKPLQYFEPLKPTIDRLTETLERANAKSDSKN